MPAQASTYTIILEMTGKANDLELRLDREVMAKLNHELGRGYEIENVIATPTQLDGMPVVIYHYTFLKR